MRALLLKINTAYALGFGNVFYVVLHRLKTKLGVHARGQSDLVPPQGPFFKAVDIIRSELKASNDWQHEALYFGWWKRPITQEPPDWHQNPMNREVCSANPCWSKLPDFDARVGDIKLIWEASRFDWVLAFAQRVSLGDEDALVRLNHWLADWCEKNPPFCGANWKCGQEAGIRVLHLAMASLMLGQTKTALPGIVDFIVLHLTRIASTLRYAMSQNNNHGTSEAAALFVGGGWLVSLGVSSGSRWQEMGRAWLENRAARLIGVQGSFSQYSVNYHRVVLDTFSMVEIWRRHLALPDFSARLQSRLVAAVQWLCAVVDPMTGAAPNLGANDGARLLPLTSGNDRDFRPCVQLAMVLFTQGRAYAADGDWNLPLHWLGIAVPDDVSARPMSDVFDDGGFAVLRHHRAMVLLNYPRFRFRPSQADLLHVDLWKDGINLLRDAGTYSYHTDSDSINYFSGTASHNTLQFDSQDQMPRLGRFLFGHWLKTHEIEPLQENADNLSFAAAYRDHRGIYHKRSIKLLPNKLQVLDKIDGFKCRAVMRWRLAPGQWWIDGNTVTNGFDRLTIESNVPILCMALVVGQESLFYLQKNDVPVLEVEVNQPGTMMSEYEWML